MRRPTTKEMRCMTNDGQIIFEESTLFNFNKCGYEISKLHDKCGQELTEPIKPQKYLVGNEEIVKSLKSQYGIKIKSIAELNTILVEMGLIEKIYKKWYQTEKGKEYSIFTIRITPPNIWTNDIIPLIADYLKENGYIPVSSSR